LFFAV